MRAEKDSMRAIFGAGSGGEIFLRRSGDNEFSLALDSDPNKSGNMLAGIIPVVHPDSLDFRGISEVVIASQFARQIFEYCILRGLSANQITIAAKRLINEVPFEDENTRAEAGLWLSYFSDALVQNGVVAIAVMGTALGAVRDSDLIPWDSDIDLLVQTDKANNGERHDNILNTATSRFGNVCRIEVQTSDHVRMIVATSSGIEFVVGVDFAPRSADRVCHHIFGSTFQFPAEWFAEPLQVNWKYGQIWCPRNIEQYLERIYGPNWQTPLMNFTPADYSTDANSRDN